MRLGSRMCAGRPRAYPLSEAGNDSIVLTVTPSHLVKEYDHAS